MTIQYIYLALAVTCTALGQLFYKKYVMEKLRAHLLCALTLFTATPALNYLALKRLSIDLVYIATSATILMVVILSKITLKEKTTLRHWLGCMIISTGIVIYAHST